MLALSLLQPPVAIRREADCVVVDNEIVRVEADRRTGDLAVVWGTAGLREITGEARLADGSTLRTSDYARHDVDVRAVRDVFGSGVRLEVRHRSPGRPELRHVAWVYAGRPEAIVRLSAFGASAARSLVPVESPNPPDRGGVLRTLFVPYDNDAYAHYRADDGHEPSHEVAARYDDATRKGLVVGSIDHDVWKTSVRMTSTEVRVVAGVADAGTRDREPHGAVAGREIDSPRISLGRYGDWRDGMERFGDLNALVRPPLPWAGGAPFGWNSWAAHKDKLTAADARNATDALASLPLFRNDGTATVTLDSYWDNLKPAQLAAFVARAHAKGLRAGLYWTPFVAWGDLASRVAGDARRTYGDLVLRDAKGEPLPRLDGGYPLDPTHPATLARIDRQLAEFVREGFDSVKLDFLTHGALEGRHHDPRIETGTMAYDRAMRRIADDLSFRKIGRPFFISLSIAPLFPSGFAHSRRISCDVFANIGATAYLMNSANYAWWEAGRLYRFNDPDHTVVYRPLGDAPTTEAEARSRFVASLVAGGMLLDSDDLGDPAALERVRRLFSRTEALDVARSGRPFRPVEGDVVEGGGETFVRADGGSTLIAAFNYDRTTPKTRTVALSRLGLEGAWTVRDLWTGETRRTEGGITFRLAPMQSSLVRLTKAR